MSLDLWESSFEGDTSQDVEYAEFSITHMEVTVEVATFDWLQYPTFVNLVLSPSHAPHGTIFL